MANELFPIIATPDVDRAVRFYGELLGGRVSYRFGGADGAPVYVGLDVGRSHVGIGLDPGAVSQPSGRWISLWVYVDDCDAVVERMRAAGVEVVEEPVDQPWGERVARVRDPDGNTVYVGARPATDAG